MSLKNYYIILGVTNTATADEIKSAYRELAKKYHPDKNHGNKSAEEYFKEIQQAYGILSNPEKRKKYDLKFFYGTTQAKQKTQAPYTGNAYQYAQQQAQQKPQFHNVKSQPKEKEKGESYQILVSVGIALILLYFIISYNTRSKKQSTQQQATPTKETTVTTTNAISNYESPYSYFFGEEVYIDESKNSITIYNTDDYEAIVCLVENTSPNKTIRNQYINFGRRFKMNNIPNGEYFLKIYYGTNWDTTKTHLDNKIKGGFINEAGFKKMNTGKDLFKMKHEQTGSSTAFSSYEIILDPRQQKDVKTITVEEFFK